MLGSRRRRDNEYRQLVARNAELAAQVRIYQRLIATWLLTHPGFREAWQAAYDATAMDRAAEKYVNGGGM